MSGGARIWPDKSIAFVGTGLMGLPMAIRLLAENYILKVWNRTATKTGELVARGATAAETPATAALGADVLILMLANGAAVTEVLFTPDMMASLRPGAMVVDMSSIPPALARGHAARLADRGIQHLDAPVSGGTKGAAEGTLAIMVGGTVAAFEAALPILTVMGRPTLIGPNGAGQLAKLANQIIVAITIGAVAEALIFAAAGGADPGKVREALQGGFADSMILKQHGRRMLDRDWIPGGPMQMQIKDLRTILEVASELDVKLPLTEGAAELFEGCARLGLENYDHSAVLLEIERRNSGLRVGTNPDG